MDRRLTYKVLMVVFFTFFSALGIRQKKSIMQFLLDTKNAYMNTF